MAVLVAAYGLPVMSKAAWNRFTSGTRDEVSVVFTQHLLSQRFVFIGSVPDDYRGLRPLFARSPASFQRPLALGP